MQRLRQLQAEIPGHYWPSQYNNPDNPSAYAAFVEQLLETLGDVGCLVGSVGSGGSMCGSTRFLRSVLPGARAVGVDTLGSVLFGQPDAGTRLLRGLGNSLMPENLDHRVFDEVHWVPAAEGFLASRQLHRQHGLYMGPTSGASFLVARWWAAQHPEVKVVAILPDEAYRYEDSVYDDSWLETQNARLHRLPEAPRQVTSPSAAGPDWSTLAWGRRSYEEVLGAPYAPATGAVP
jgi:cysteine synthase A